MIREARPDELPKVARLRWRWLVENGRTPQGDQATFAAEFADWARRHAESHRCFVALRGDEVVGMAWLAIVPRVPTPAAPDRLSGDVQSVYVVPELRDAGVGGELIDEIVAAAGKDGCERVTVHSSPRAIRMYERHGFASATELLQVRPPLSSHRPE